MQDYQEMEEIKQELADLKDSSDEEEMHPLAKQAQETESPVIGVKRDRDPLET